MDFEPVGPDAAIGADDRAAEYRVRRICGAPGDDNTTTETILFHAG
ncbi:hypothetical protein [Arthrobacter sp. KBS0702]|nr:hypothetical protein [Arthrobacter sp. KBS0702]